jgi:hypothetical protein
LLAGSTSRASVRPATKPVMQATKPVMQTEVTRHPLPAIRELSQLLAQPKARPDQWRDNGRNNFPDLTLATESEHVPLCSRLRRKEFGALAV